MYWDVKTVKPMPDYRIYVEVENGLKGIFDLKPYLDRGVFRELKDIHYFNRVGILFGAVTWPNEQDKLRPANEKSQLGRYKCHNILRSNPLLSGHLTAPQSTCMFFYFSRSVSTPVQSGGTPFTM